MPPTRGKALNRPKKRLNLPLVLGVVVTAALYGVSLFQPAVEIEDDVTSVRPGWYTVALPPLLLRDCVSSAWQTDNFWRSFFNYWDIAGTLSPAAFWSAIFVPWMANPLLIAGTIFLFLRRWHSVWIVGAL